MNKRSLESRGIKNPIVRKLVCVNNENYKDSLSVGREYISKYDFSWNKYCLLVNDLGASEQLYKRELFQVIEN